MTFYKSLFLNLQQRRLFRIFTGFPFNHATCVNLVDRKTSNILLLIITEIHHRQPIMKLDDSLRKSILEDLLLFFYPHASNVFDFSRNFEYLDKELDQLFPPEANSSGIRFVDKLVKVHCKNGGDQWTVTAFAFLTAQKRCFHKPISALRRSHDSWG